MEKNKLWNDVRQTDVSATKDVSLGGRKSTSINGYSMLEAATKQWGPMGVEWGFEIEEERYDVGVPITDSNGEKVCDSKTHTIKLSLWFPDCKKPVVQFGHTPYIYKSKSGPMVDAEAPKKSLMDAMKKCLSMLGFSADVFLGEFDDRTYVDELKNQQAIEKAVDKDAERLSQAKEYDAWKAKHMEFLKTAQSMNELEQLFKLMIRKMNLASDTKSIQEVVAIKDQRKQELDK